MNFSPTQVLAPDDLFASQNELETATKTRSRRPCDSCRRRKSRCEIIDAGPPCVLCRFHRQECTFVEEPQPRKRRAVGSSELDQTAERDVNHRAPISNSRKLSSTFMADVPKIRQEPPVADYADLRGPSLLKKTLGLQNHRHSRFIGSTSVYEQALIELEEIHDTEELPIGLSALRKVDTHSAAFILTPDTGTRNHDDEIGDLDSIESIVTPHGQALIHLYFRIVHPSFPVLHKRVFLEKYQRTHREFSPPLLAAVYILALNWWAYSSELALLPKPDVSRLEALAFKTINDIIHRPKLSTIQAGLLLLQRPEGDSWALTTQLTGLGQDLGLHLDCTSWKIPSWERGLRKRLAWALFMQDRWGALMHGRPSHITTVDWDVMPLEEDDFPENADDEDDEDGSAEVEKGRTLFCEMIKLTEILSSVLSNFYTLKVEKELESQAHLGVRQVLERAKPIQLSLRQWYSELPASLKMDSITVRKLSSTGYLHLGYYAVEITLHRRIVRTLSPVDDPSLRLICRQAAQARLNSAIEFVRSLRPEHLQSFWYSASKYCFVLVGTFTSLLWVTSSSKEEADMHKSNMDEYRWTLRLCSRSAGFLERAISMLATSSDMLMKEVSERRNADFMLNRHFQRASQSLPIAQHRGDIMFQEQSTTYQSDSECHEDTSPENVFGKTPLESVVNGDWNAEQPWFMIGTDNSEDIFCGSSNANAYIETLEPQSIDRE